MTPSEALRRAQATDDADTADIVATFVRRLDARAFYATDRVATIAALDLCTARTHDRRLRACITCRIDISRATRSQTQGVLL